MRKDALDGGNALHLVEGVFEESICGVNVRQSFNIRELKLLETTHNPL
jgi:hypothetical protein